MLKNKLMAFSKLNNHLNTPTALSMTTVAMTTVAALSLATFCLWSTATTAAIQTIPVDRVVTIVEDDVILESELFDRVREIKNQIQGQRRQLPPNDILIKQVLERLILESIQVQMASLMGVRVDDNEVNVAMKNIAKQNDLDLEQFKKTVESEGLSYRSLRDQIRREITINHVRQRHISSRLRVSDQDIENFLDSKAGRTELAADYRLGHILIPLPDAPSADMLQKASDLAMDIYSKLVETPDQFEQLAISLSAGQNALEGGDLGWRSPAQLPTIFADVVLEMEKEEVSKPIKSPSGFHIIKITDKRGGTTMFVDQTEVRHILVKPNEIRSDADAEQLIEDIYRRLVDGSDFVDLAKTYSDDPGSALNGGDLGWVSPGAMVPAFEEVMQKTAVEETSKPFRSQFGWHILEVNNRRNQDMSEEYKFGHARNLVRKRKFEEELQVWLREIREEAFVEIKI
ncbi:MAG: peptidylprolyl isomerase [Pseudomonadales bacterium]|nr:peptidylprolyl isomerase [Pseudomonadales bacterium]